MALTSNGVPPSSQAAGQNAVGRMGIHVPGRTRYAPPPPESFLTEGQIIRGEITDLRNKEVTVTLEDNTKIHGYLEDGSNLSIGDTAAFKVTSKADGEITLKALPKSEASQENAVFNKALEEAGLPKNEKNQEIVRELMKNQLPIHKQAIQQILKEAYSNPEVSVSTLVILTKHRIPITPETALQMERYRNYEHRLVKELLSMADGLPALLKELSGEEAPLSPIPFADKLFEILLLGESGAALSPDRNPPALFDAPAQADELIDILETFQLPDRLRSELLDNTASLRDIAAAVTEGMEIARRLDEAPLALLKGADPSPGAASPGEPSFTPEELAELPKASSLFDTPVIASLLEKFGELQSENSELASFLTSRERAALTEGLKGIAVNRLALAEIEEGSATAKETLAAVRKALPHAGLPAAKALFCSDEFSAVLKEAIVSGWTLTPRQLSKERSVDRLYGRLDQQLSLLKALTQTVPHAEGAKTLFSQAGQTKENIDFMQLLNEMYTYVQLPIRLRERCVHSDLYVYTRKSRLIEHPDEVSVLLHLDMDYMGPLDIHIALHGERAAAKFYCADPDTEALLSRYLDDLTAALLEKGFPFTAQTALREKDIDIVKDFMEKDLPSTSLKRYNFDIRA